MPKVKIKFFTAEWCGACKARKEFILSLAKDYPITVELLDIDTAEGAAEFGSLGFAAIPSFVWENGNGEVLGSTTGGDNWEYIDLTEDALKQEGISFESPYYGTSYDADTATETWDDGTVIGGSGTGTGGGKPKTGSEAKDNKILWYAAGGVGAILVIGLLIYLFRR